jgi:hypothetical protein
MEYQDLKSERGCWRQWALQMPDSMLPNYKFGRADTSVRLVSKKANSWNRSCTPTMMDNDKTMVIDAFQMQEIDIFDRKNRQKRANFALSRSLLQRQKENRIFIVVEARSTFYLLGFFCHKCLILKDL